MTDKNNDLKLNVYLVIDKKQFFENTPPMDSKQRPKEALESESYQKAAKGL